MLGERKPLFLRRRDQFAVAQQYSRTIVMAVFDPRTDTYDVHGQNALEFADEVDDLVLLLPRDLGEHRD